MALRIGVTGSQGLIGKELCRALAKDGTVVRPLDIKLEPFHDVKEKKFVEPFVKDLDGIIHLAAVSRVVWAQKDPWATLETNVQGTLNILLCAAKQTQKPWVMFASSREVYGNVNADAFPVTEERPRLAMNIYGKTKVIGEDLVFAARHMGLRTGVIRFSNVYGKITDHHDRVTPAFARAAVEGRPLHVEGPTRVFDFVHIDDAVAGATAYMEFLKIYDSPPTIHFSTGVGTSLHDLAKLCVKKAESKSPIEIKAGRDYDVEGFVGDSSYAKKLLDWEAKVTLEEGVARMVRDFKEHFASRKLEAVA